MYKERKAIEVAASFLRRKADLTMDYYDLVKLIYLTDREQILRRGRTVTGDVLWSLPWGPVVGAVLDAVRNDTSPAWSRHIRTDRQKKKSTLVVDAPPAALSRADLDAVDAVWEKFGHMDGGELMRYTHRLPEYTDTDGRVLISIEDVARAVGRTEEEIDAILSRERERDAVQRFKASLSRSALNV